MHNLQILAKIFKNESVIKRYFLDEAEMTTIIEPFLTLFEQSFRENQGSPETTTKLSVSGWHDLFDTMVNFYPLVKLLERGDLLDCFGELLRHSVRALDSQIKCLRADDHHSQ